MSPTAAAPLSTGDTLPEIPFNDNTDRATSAYLGTGMDTPFSLSNMKGSFFVIEVFNVFCTMCPKNIPLLNALYTGVARDPKLKSSVKIIGIAAGNTSKELHVYARQYQLSFPSFADERFSAYKALGRPRVPYTLFLKKNGAGKLVLVSAHQGIYDRSTVLLDMVRNLLSETIK